MGPFIWWFKIALAKLRNFPNSQISLSLAWLKMYWPDKISGKHFNWHLEVSKDNIIEKIASFMLLMKRWLRVSLNLEKSDELFLPFFYPLPNSAPSLHPFICLIWTSFQVTDLLLPPLHQLTPQSPEELFLTPCSDSSFKNKNQKLSPPDEGKNWPIFSAVPQAFL